MKRIRILTIGFLAGLLLTGCKAGFLEPPITMTPTPLPAEMVSPTPTEVLSPTVTPTPTPSPTITPSPTPSPSPTPDISGVTDGGVNGKAVFDENDKLIKAADVEPGSMIYCNNFERSLGNRFAKGNISDGCEFEVTDAQAFSGSDSIHVTMRRETTWGLSGAGIVLNETNGLSYNDLVGHTVEIVCQVLYLDEGWGVEDEITFALYDTYHSEVVSVPKRNISNDIEYDKEGNVILVSERRPVLCDICAVKKGEWTTCHFTVTITAADAKKGMLLIGTKDEAQNPVGAYVSYYLDDLYIMVVE